REGSMPFVTLFDAPDAHAHDLVGGKGANLGRMTAAGFGVPPGFTVTTEAHARFLDRGVLETVLELVADLDYADADSVRSGTAKVRDFIAAADMPEEVDEAIRTAYGALGSDVFVAVRSSGTAEDLAGASFAGLPDTSLVVRGA